jgi:hypothetical protein
VVIASSNPAALLEQCLAALAPQVASTETEVIVVRASGRADSIDKQRWSGSMPLLRWIDAPEHSTVPRLRGLGLAAARAERIALLEDDCIVAADWCRQALSLEGPAVATGGAVEPDSYDRTLDWAVYFCEYGRFMRPLVNSPGAPLTGNNVVYTRAAFTRLPPESLSEFRETFVHAAWQRAGVPTTVTDRLVVTNVNRWQPRHVTSVPFHHGRAYAAERFAQRSGVSRLGFAILAIGLPLLKSARIVGETLSRKRLLGRLVAAFPWILVFVTSWSAGEFAGCLWGAGSSPSRWR